MHNSLLSPRVARLMHDKSKLSGVNLVVAEDEQEAEDRLRKNVQDTVKDGLGVGVDDIAALGQAPGDWVEEPQEEGQHATLHERALYGASEGIRVAAAINGKLVGDEEEGGCAEGKVSPLVGGLGQGADQAADDHNLVGEDSDQDGGPGESRRQEEVREKQRSRDEPVDVPDVEHLSGPGGGDGGTAWPLELGHDGGLAEVRGHGPVGDTGDGGDSGGDVVEQTVGLRLGEGEAHEGEGGSAHDRAHGEVPVRTTDGDSEIAVCKHRAVYVERLIPGHDEGCQNRQMIVAKLVRMGLSWGNNVTTLDITDISLSLGYQSETDVLTEGAPMKWMGARKGI